MSEVTDGGGGAFFNVEGSSITDFIRDGVPQGLALWLAPGCRCQELLMEMSPSFLSSVSRAMTIQIVFAAVHTSKTVTHSYQI